MNLQETPLQHDPAFFGEEHLKTAVSAAMKSTGRMSLKKTPTGTRDRRTPAASAAATNANPVTEFTRNSPRTRTATARILARGSNP